MLKLLLIFILAFNLNASYLGGKVKKSITSKAVSSVVKKNTNKKIVKKVKDLVGKKIHGNSLDYKGDVHVYKIKNKDGLYKIGESSQGVNSKGLSKRAESQVSKLRRTTGDSTFNSKIIKKFDNKKDARNYEKKLIEKTRIYYGKDKNNKSVLLGNKINR